MGILHVHQRSLLPHFPYPKMEAILVSIHIHYLYIIWRGSHINNSLISHSSSNDFMEHFKRLFILIFLDKISIHSVKSFAVRNADLRHFSTASSLSVQPKTTIARRDMIINRNARNEPPPYRKNNTKTWSRSLVLFIIY